MNEEEYRALNEATARLDGWGMVIEDCPDLEWHHEMHGVVMDIPDYLGDPRLWAPLLERLIRAGWLARWRPLTGRYWMEPTGIDSGFCGGGDTLAEAVCRLFVALEGEV